MGKVLKILGVVFLVLVVGFVGLLLWSHQKGEAVYEEFYEAVLSGDTARVMERLHPELRAKIDEPVLAVWMAAVKTHLGAFDGLSAGNFSTSSRTENGRSVVEAKGTVRFEKGDAKAELKLVEDQVVAFWLTADALPAEWFQEAPDVTSYVEDGREVLTLLLTGGMEEAYSRMHESLQREMPLEQLGPGLEGLHARVGDFVSMEATGHEFEPGDTPELKIHYAVTCKDKPAVGYVRYQFSPWKAHLVGFNLKPAP